MLERAAILCDGGLIVADHLALRAMPSARPANPASAPQPAPILAVKTPPGDLHAAERALIERALRDARFNKSQAAKILGVTRSQLYVRLRKHGLE